MKLKLIEKEYLLDNIWAFRFEPSEPWTWTAGQYISVELPHDNPDGKGTKRWFTVSSAPYEKIVQITTRVTDSSFKQALASLEIGSEALVPLDTPHGSFVWQDTGRPLVFLAGGIGITPFRTILKQRAHDGLPLSATLVYGSRTSEMSFKDELEAWARADNNFKVYFVVGTQLTAEAIAELVPGLNDSFVYLSGPQALVAALDEGLRAQGLPHTQLKKDFFPNYTTGNY